MLLVFEGFGFRGSALFPFLLGFGFRGSTFFPKNSRSQGLHVGLKNCGFGALGSLTRSSRPEECVEVSKRLRRFGV